MVQETKEPAALIVIKVTQGDDLYRMNVETDTREENNPSNRLIVFRDSMLDGLNKAISGLLTKKP